MAFAFSAVRVRNSSGLVVSELTTDEAFSVEIEYRNLQPGSTLGATLFALQQRRNPRLQFLE
jgi:hypothetical protein